MYVARRPSAHEVAQNKAHADWLSVAAAERARFEQGWRFIGTAGEPALIASFSNSLSAPLAYFKESEGFVMLAGECIYNGAVDYTNYTVMFNLPVGYRPGRQLRLFEPGASTLLLIYPDGNVYFRMAAFYSYRTIRLDAMRFRTN